MSQASQHIYKRTNHEPSRTTLAPTVLCSVSAKLHFTSNYILCMQKIKNNNNKKQKTCLHYSLVINNFPATPTLFSFRGLPICIPDLYFMHARHLSSLNITYFNTTFQRELRVIRTFVFYIFTVPQGLSGYSVFESADIKLCFPASRFALYKIHFAAN